MMRILSLALLLGLAPAAAGREPVEIALRAPLGFKMKDIHGGEYAGLGMSVRYAWLGVDLHQLWTRWLPVPGSSASTDALDLALTASLPLAAEGRLRAEGSGGFAWFKDQRNPYRNAPGYLVGGAIRHTSPRGWEWGLMGRFSKGEYADGDRTEIRFDDQGQARSYRVSETTVGFLLALSLGYAFRL